MKVHELATSLLAPPGEGVFTVSNARERKERLQQKLYPNGDVRRAWQQSLAQLETATVALLGVPSDCGGGILRGANWGPLLVREELLKDQDAEWLDLGDVRVIPHLLSDELLNQATLRSCREALYQNADSPWPVSPLSITEYFLQHLYQASRTRVFAIGGDHSVSHPLVRAWAQARRGKRIALLHFDAHTDLLASRLGITVTFGSWTYHVREFFPHPDRLIQVGIRSTMKERSYWEKEMQVTQYWPQEVEELGAPGLADRIIAAYQRAGVEEVYISFDIDALDSQWAQATGTPEARGLDPLVCSEVIRRVARRFPVTGADLVEVAPFVNHDFAPNNSQQLTLMSAAGIARVLLESLRAHA